MLLSPGSPCYWEMHSFLNNSRSTSTSLRTSEPCFYSLIHLKELDKEFDCLCLKCISGKIDVLRVLCDGYFHPQAVHVYVHICVFPGLSLLLGNETAMLSLVLSSSLAFLTNALI